MLEVRLLGQFDIRLDDKPIEIASRPAQSLLAYLILNAGCWHRREMLAGMLWPLSTEANARNNLRQALWRIRKAIEPQSEDGPAYLVADNFTIGFNPEAPHQVDASILIRSIPEAWTANELMDCVKLYEGELLPGFYEDWVVLERGRLNAVYANKMHLLLDRLLQERRWRESLEWSERWIALGEAPEPAYRALMIAYYHLSDSSNLAASYQRCLEALEDRLGVGPSQKTKELYEQLSTGKFEADESSFLPSETSIADPPQYRKTTSHPEFLDREADDHDEVRSPFVARTRELEKLDDLLEKTLADQGQVAFVTGITGSGKTALVMEFARRSQKRIPELIVSLGRCNSLTGIGDPYLPFREALALLTHDMEAKWQSHAISTDHAQQLWEMAPRTIQALVNEGPDLIDSFVQGKSLLLTLQAHRMETPIWFYPVQRRLEGNAVSQIDMQTKQEYLFEQYTRVLQTISRPAPLLLILDDFQWADVGSIGLLFYLCRRIQEDRIFVLCCHRPLEDKPGSDREGQPLLKAISEFKRTLGDITIDLSKVEEAERMAFIDDFLNTEANRLDADFRRELFRHTHGHPLFTIELLRAMETRGDIAQDKEARWVVKPDLNWGELPARVEGVVEQRMRRLGENLKELLTVASVEGEKFTAEVAAIILESDLREIVSSLSRELDKRHRLVRAQGIRRLPSGRISEYRFQHILFQKHLYGRLDAIERAHAHEHVGAALEKLYGEDAAEIAVQLAHHFDTAGVPEKSVMYLQVAAERAKRLSANNEAVVHLERALALLKTLPPSTERNREELTMLTSLGVALVAAKGYGAEEVEQAFTKAHQLTTEVGDNPQMFSVLYGLRSYYLARGDCAKASVLSEQLLRMAQKAEDIDLLIEAHQALGTVNLFLGGFEVSRRHLERCLELYELERHRTHALRFGQDPGVTCLSYLASILWCLGYPDQGLQKNREALALAERAAHPFSMALALNYSALFNRFYGDLQTAQAQAEEALTISNQHGFPFWAGMAKSLRGVLMVDQGDLKGLDLLRRGLKSWQATGTELARSTFLTFLGWGYGVNGEVDKGLQVLNEAADEMTRSGDRLIETELHRLRGELLRLHGAKTEEIETCYQRAIEIAKRQRAKTFELKAKMDLCRSWAKQGKKEKARRRLKSIFDDFTEGFDTLLLMNANTLLAELS
jgi:DNA-binding SARP family transcriptional activator/predicted ATPase